MMGRSLARLFRPLIARSPRLALAFRSYRDSAHMDCALVTTPLGFRFVGHPGMERGTYEPEEVALVSRLLTQADVFVNVGANIGYYCCLALKSGCPVVAVEPVPNNLQLLYRNLRANEGTSRAEVHPVALGAETGLVDIYGGGTAASLLEGWADIPVAYRQTVPLTSLDQVLGDRFAGQRSLVLIDVEGAELGVLQGAQRLLDAHPKPIWIIEISIDEHQPRGRRLNPNLVATFDMFEQRGYKAWIVGDQLQPLDYALIRAIAARGSNSLNRHNFLFADPATGVAD